MTWILMDFWPELWSSFWWVLIWFLMGWVLKGSVGSDLGSDRPGCLAHHREVFQVLYDVSFLGKLLIQRTVQREHQGFHFVSDRTLQNANTQTRTSTSLSYEELFYFSLCPGLFLFVFCLLIIWRQLVSATDESRVSLNAPAVLVFRSSSAQDQDTQWWQNIN